MVGMCRPPRRHVCVCTKCESHKQRANARSVHLPRMRENSQFFFLCFRSFSFFHVAHETEWGNKKQLWNEHWTIWEMKMPPSAWSRHTATNTILSHKMCVCVRALEKTLNDDDDKMNFSILFFVLYEWANAISHTEPWDVRRSDFVEVKWCKVLSDLLTDFLASTWKRNQDGTTCALFFITIASGRRCPWCIASIIDLIKQTIASWVYFWPQLIIK